MGAKTKNQIVLKKQKCGGFLFKVFEPKMSIRSTNVALAGNVFGLCVRQGLWKRICQLKNKQQWKTKT